MATETYSFFPKKFFAGDSPPIVTVPGTLLSGQNLEVGTPLAVNADGKLFSHPGNTSGFVSATSAGDADVAFDTTLPVAGILAYSVNASTGTTNNAGKTVVAGVAADTNCNIYTSVNVFASELTWKVNGGSDMANVTTDILKQKLFYQSKIVLTFQDVGQV